MAERTEIMDAIESLALHCRAPLMSVEQRASWIRDWCDDLRGFDIAAIRAATARWRASDNAKFPTPGQLLPLVRGQATAERDAGAVAAPWKPLTYAAYDELTLTEKIRHQRILANQARGKAGPQWRGGKPATPDQMPAAWHAWRQRAQNHDAEARRLQQVLEKSRAKHDEESGAA